MTLKRPFDAHTLPALVMKIMKGSYDPVPDMYSTGLKKLLMNMLHLDPNQRPSAAQIMCQPLMISVIFQLYVDIGSIPCTKRINKAESSTSRLSSNSSSSDSNFNSIKLKDGFAGSEDIPNVWFFQSSSTNVTLLPSPSKGFIKTVALGENQKVGLTNSGLLISWQTSSPKIFVQDEFNNEERIRSPTYVVNIVEEKFAVNISEVACGNDFTVCKSDSGVVYTFGKASSGCLGHPSAKDVSEPRIVEALFSHNITSIACGPKHILAVSEENEVFAWGYNSQGCLGLDNVDFQALPKAVTFQCQNGKPEKIFCGPNCSFIITKDSKLLACGSNRHNKLALDSGEGQQIDESKVFIPVCSEPLPNLKILSVSAGMAHTVILCEDKAVYSVGSNQHFQLGWGEISMNYSMPGRIENFDHTKISQIACSSYCTLAVASDNTFYCWGKCPKSLNTKDSICSIERPPHFSKKAVLFVACDSESCLILTKDKPNC